MYISRAEQRKVFIDCLKHYSLFFIFLLGLTIFEYVIFASPRNEFFHNMLRVTIVLYGIAHLYLTDVSTKVEKKYENKPEERYANTYNYIVLLLCVVCMIASISLPIVLF